MVYAKFERQTECVMGISRIETGQNNMHFSLFLSTMLLTVRHAIHQTIIFNPTDTMR